MRSAGEVAAELLEVAGLAGKIELAPHDATKLGDSCLRPIRLQLGQFLGQLCQTGQNIEIDFHAAADSGMLHLHHHVVTIR